MKLNKYISIIIACSVLYLICVEIAGDAKLLSDIQYINNLGIVEIGWKTIVKAKTWLLGNSKTANIVFIYAIQIACLFIIYDTANKTDKKVLTALLFITMLLPVAIRIQIRLGAAVVIWVNSIVTYWVNQNTRRLVVTSVIASTMHQAIAFLSVIVILCAFVKKVASKGGTTEKALMYFSKNDKLEHIINDAIKKAEKKSKDLSKYYN